MGTAGPHEAVGSKVAPPHYRGRESNAPHTTCLLYSDSFYIYGTLAPEYLGTQVNFPLLHSLGYRSSLDLIPRLAMPAH